jgi:hypothetical protein
MNHSGFEYEVEGGIDFFSQLKQMTAADTEPAPAPAPAPLTDDAAATATAPRCLITDEPLRRDHVTLQCGHKFNYVPLFKDVLFQKCPILPKNLSSNIITTYTSPSANYHHSVLPTNQSHHSGVHSVMYNSSYNLETNKLQYNEMKCPYCRVITPNILPYYPYPDVSKVKYVNIPPNLSLPAVSCEYEKFVSGDNTIFATNEPTSCRSNCIYNEKYGLMLCNKHLNKIEVRATATATATAAAAATTVKTTTRTRAKKSNINGENVIISHHNPATSVCPFVLLSGPRKGCPCEKPMWIPKTPSSSAVAVGLPAFCKAHWGRAPPNGASYAL